MSSPIKAQYRYVLIYNIFTKSKTMHFNIDCKLLNLTCFIDNVEKYCSYAQYINNMFTFYSNIVKYIKTITIR